jgi:crossover junction endodeoxyribonuclease RusA
VIRAVLPYPPSTNTLYRNVAGKGRVKTAKYKAWIDEAGFVLVFKRLPAITGPYVLQIDLFQADARRRDIDNGIKAISDLLVEHQLIEDDSKCVELHVRKVRSDTAYAEIKVRSAIEERKVA